MPNGNSQFIWKERPSLDIFFSEIGVTLTKFAEDHNLRIDKYWHQFPSWRLSFKHPKGGLACIEVMRENETEVQVYSYWWIDDYEKATRYSRKEVTSVFRPDRVNVYDLLEQRIMSLLSWAPNSWTDTTAGYERDWSSTKKDDFLKIIDAYPVPKI